MSRHEKRQRLTKLITIFIALSAASLAVAFSTGPLPGFTNAPGESNCTECHDSFGETPNQGIGFMTIQAPSRYEPGQRYPITIQVTHPGQRRWGFEVTALTADTDQPAGQFVITDPLHTQLIEGADGRLYVEHTEAGTFAGRPSGARWTFDWIAPETDRGPVAFYAAGNASNNDGTRLGDWIYTTTVSVSPPSFPAVTLVSPQGGEVVSPGESLSIQWEAVNATSFDILFFPRSGALPQSIVSGLPSDRRSYEWTVPDALTDSASIGVLAFNDVGFGLDEKSFMIVDKASSLIEVINPNDRYVVKGGAPLTITWRVDDRADVRQQQIRLSFDGGVTFPFVLAPSLPARARQFEWVVPTTLRTDSARILVIARLNDGRLIADAGDQDFIIFNPIMETERVRSPGS